MAVVPQLNDYLCPVCFSVAYRPVRLDCQHVFCIRCVVKIQRRNEKQCPLCRADVVMRATAGKTNDSSSQAIDADHIQTTLIEHWRSIWKSILLAKSRKRRRQMK